MDQENDSLMGEAKAVFTGKTKEFIQYLPIDRQMFRRLLENRA